jgi:hypothetical protein
MDDCAFSDCMLKYVQASRSRIHGCIIRRSYISDEMPEWSFRQIPGLSNTARRGSRVIQRPNKPEKLGMPFSLRELPVEIRRQIFHYAIAIDWKGGDVKLITALKDDKQLYHEALSVLAKENWISIVAEEKDFANVESPIIVDAWQYIKKLGVR